MDNEYGRPGATPNLPLLASFLRSVDAVLNFLSIANSQGAFWARKHWTRGRAARIGATQSLLVTRSSEKPPHRQPACLALRHPAGRHHWFM
jgi:hypothetical protein